MGAMGYARDDGGDHVGRRNDLASTFTTGPFAQPFDGATIDWEVLNNDVERQQVRVSVFRLGLGAPKQSIPGPLTLTVDPGQKTHDANHYTTEYTYEVEVQINSPLVFPSVCVWKPDSNEAASGTLIPSAMFIPAMPRRSRCGWWREMIRRLLHRLTGSIGGGGQARTGPGAPEGW